MVFPLGHVGRGCKYNRCRDAGSANRFTVSGRSGSAGEGRLRPLTVTHRLPAVPWYRPVNDIWGGHRRKNESSIFRDPYGDTKVICRSWNVNDVPGWHAPFV